MTFSIAITGHAGTSGLPYDTEIEAVRKATAAFRDTLRAFGLEVSVVSVNGDFLADAPIPPS